MAVFEPALGQVLFHKHKASELGATLDTRYVKKGGDSASGNYTFSGHFGIGSGATPDSINIVNVNETLNSSTNDVTGVNVIILSNAATTHQVLGLQFLAESSIASGTIAVVGGMFGGAQTLSGENVTTMYGGFFQPAHMGSGTVSSLIGMQTAIKNTSSGTVTTGYGVLIGQAVKSGSGAITTNYGLFIDSQTVGGTNYSIWTNSGVVHFGDKVEANDNMYVPYGSYFSVDRNSNWPSGTHNLIGVTWNGSADQTEIYTPGSVRSTPMLCLTADAKIGFFNHAVASQGTSGADLTNNVTSGGSSDVIADFTNLTTYSTDAATIRNDIYQLARKLKQVNDALRAYGLLT